VVRITVDTNVVGGKPWQPLESNEMRRLLDRSRRGEVRLIIAEVVVREAANLWSETVIEAQAEAEKALRILRQARVVETAPPAEATAGSVREEEEARIRKIVTEAGGEIAPLPGADHEDLLERALRREQPFDQQGQNGYRDVLLWETVLALEPGDPVYLVSEDRNAFYAGRKGNEVRLAEGLADEATERFGGDGLRLFDGPDEAISEALAHFAATKVEELVRAETEKKAKDEALADEEARRRLNELYREDPGFSLLLEDAIGEALAYRDLGWDLRDFGIEDSEVHSAHVVSVETITEVDFISAHVAAEGEVLADLRARVVLLADATAHPATASLMERNPLVHVIDQGFESGVASAQLELLADVEVDLVIDPDKATLRSLATISRLLPLSPIRTAAG
jgi:PIN domain